MFRLEIPEHPKSVKHDEERWTGIDAGKYTPHLGFFGAIYDHNYGSLYLFPGVELLGKRVDIFVWASSSDNALGLLQVNVDRRIKSTNPLVLSIEQSVAPTTALFEFICSYRITISEYTPL